MIAGERRGITPKEQIKAYYDFGWKVLRLRARDKKPVGSGWQLGAGVPEETAQAWAANGGGIGLQMGEVSDWLCAVDLDAPELRRLAPLFLPETLKTGKEREDLPSHFIYRSQGAAFLQITDIGGKEFLAFKSSADGAGHQICVPPSQHATKGAYTWVPAFSPPAILDAGAASITTAIRRLGVAGLVLRHLPDEGRHGYSKAIAGVLLRRGYDAEDLAEIFEIVWKAAGAPRDGIRAAPKNVRDTAQKLEDDKPVTGGTRLNEITPGLTAVLVKAAGLDRMQPVGTEEGGDGTTEKPDDSALARLWLYRRSNLKHSPHGWLQYGGGWWKGVEKGLVTQDMLRLMDKTPVNVSSTRLNSVASLAESHGYIRGDVWDANPDILVCSNGTLDLNTFKLRDHRPEDRALGGLPFEYHPEAKAEAWNHFIGARLAPGEWEFLQEFVGYCLTTGNDYETTVWLVGAGGTGKSTFVEGVQKIMGYRAGRLSLSDLDRSHFALENTIGKTLLTATEQPSNFIKHVELLNAMISGEMISVNRKGIKALDVRSTAKILWAMNRLPQVREEGSGFFRRIHPVTFPQFEGKAAPEVKRRVVDLEGPGILAWAVEGLRRLRERNGFDVPPTVRAAMADFEHGNDPAAQFLEDLCIVGEDHATPLPELQEVYSAWCRLNNYGAKGRNNVKEDMERLGVKQGRTKKARFWKLKIDRTSGTFPLLDIPSERKW